MSTVGDEAAARMAYWCSTTDAGGVGYDQATREEIRDLSYISTPRLTGAVDSDCSAMVAAACNLGLVSCRRVRRTTMRVCCRRPRGRGR